MYRYGTGFKPRRRVDRWGLNLVPYRFGYAPAVVIDRPPAACRSAPRRLWLPLCLALLAWSGAVVRGGFALDDREAIEGNPVVEGGAPWWEAFRRDYWHHRGDAGHFRPLASLSLRLDRALYGERAWGYHLTSLLLHLAAVLLAGRLLLQAGPGPWPALGLGLFAAHPVLADSVAWISGRTSTVSAAAGLLGALAVARAGARPLPLAAAAFLGLLAALCGKEDGLAFGLLYAALALPRGRAALGAVLAGAGAAVLAWLALRWQALGAPLPAAPHAPLAGEPLAARLQVAGRALLEGLRLLAAPLGYPPTYSGAPLFERGSPLWRGELAWLGWLPWLALLAAGAATARRRLGPPALLTALAVVPVLQLVPAGEVFAPRFLYLPLLFGVPLADALLRRVGAALPGPRARRGAAALLFACCAGLAWERAGVYADRGAYRREVLQWHPRDARSWNDLGLHHEEEGRPDEAGAAWRRAAALDPGYGRPWSNLARLALAAGDPEGAEEAARRAAALGPNNPVAHCNLGAVLLRRERAAEAAEAYGRATRLAPGLAAAWRGLGSALARQGRPD